MSITKIRAKQFLLNYEIYIFLNYGNSIIINSVQSGLI